VLHSFEVRKCPKLFSIYVDVMLLLVLIDCSPGVLLSVSVKSSIRSLTMTVFQRLELVCYIPALW